MTKKMCQRSAMEFVPRSLSIFRDQVNEFKRILDGKNAILRKSYLAQTEARSGNSMIKQKKKTLSLLARVHEKMKKLGTKDWMLAATSRKSVVWTAEAAEAEFGGDGEGLGGGKDECGGGQEGGDGSTETDERQGRTLKCGGAAATCALICRPGRQDGEREVQLRRCLTMGDIVDEGFCEVIVVETK